jgi:hypothetical protein
MSQVPPVQRFHEVAIGIAETVHAIVEELEKEKKKIAVKSAITKFGVQVITAFPPKDLITGFLAKSEPTWNSIINRDESFFLKTADTLFAELPMEEVSAFKKLVEKDKSGNRLIKDDDVIFFWDSFTVLVKIMISYLDEKYKKSPANVEYYVLDKDDKKIYKTRLVDYKSYASVLKVQLKYTT